MDIATCFLLALVVKTHALAGSICPFTTHKLYARATFPKSVVGETTSKYEYKTQDEGVDLVDVWMFKDVIEIGAVCVFLVD